MKFMKRIKNALHIAKEIGKFACEPFYSIKTNDDPMRLYTGPLIRNFTLVSALEIASFMTTGKPIDLPQSLSPLMPYIAAAAEVLVAEGPLSTLAQYQLNKKKCAVF
jgi:hypothetical protein